MSADAIRLVLAGMLSNLLPIEPKPAQSLTLVRGTLCLANSRTERSGSSTPSSSAACQACIVHWQHPQREQPVGRFAKKRFLRNLFAAAARLPGSLRGRLHRMQLQVALAKPLLQTESVAAIGGCHGPITASSQAVQINPARTNDAQRRMKAL
jgi:hypothetical protein